MKNIFENAKFGDIFLTRDGRKAIYHRYGLHHLLITEEEEIECHSNGKEVGYNLSDNDIVSIYKDPIDEKTR